MTVPLIPELLTGNAEIDRQHHQVFELVEALKLCVESLDSEKAKDIFAGFLHHIITHFVFEETLMYKVKYPRNLLNKHRLAHSDLQELYLRTYNPAVSGLLEVSELLELFEFHFVHHLYEEDLPLATFIQELGLPLSTDVE